MVGKVTDSMVMLAVVVAVMQNQAAMDLPVLDFHWAAMAAKDTTPTVGLAPMIDLVVAVVDQHIMTRLLAPPRAAAVAAAGAKADPTMKVELW
jgi:hypothetical protein